MQKVFYLILKKEIMLFIEFTLKRVQFQKIKEKLDLEELIDIRNFDGYQYSDLIKESNKSIDILQKRIIVQSKSLDEINKTCFRKRKIFTSDPCNSAC